MIKVNNDCCAWSKYNGGCADPCDFKTLPYEKEAIIDRMKEEAKWFEITKTSITHKMDVEAAEELFKEVADKIQGMQIMTNRLKIDFGVSDKELKSMIKTKQDPIAGMKLAFALTKLQFKRKSK